ncbi:hypothetical protein J31TS4_02920 [Paenibacillus sp. J31TS4]|uniref:hypothetical protein n=1 Tax=Paenibacillus sp. J31TS4 TaxID=2807195 RepID=UPI001AFF24F1|nr:hypothetical protein [Paenibacillus sp. J31TS4]GIP37012.1 hypothetical protein J31TS4_02920 [Paenibacillus sp. J31TS4]
MSLSSYYILLFVIVLIGTIGTIMVGASKQNKEGNPDYDKETKGIFTKLSLYYVVAIVIGFGALIWYIFK